jgi:serine/threonine-protein kinase
MPCAIDALREELAMTALVPITKGWSGDKKYEATAADGTRRLLRISPMERYDARKALFALLERVAALGAPMCEPIRLGTCSQGVYMTQSWIDGDDLEELLPSLSEAEQYALGVKSGEILRTIHSISAPEDREDWAIHFGRKTDTKIVKYKECGLRFPGDEDVLSYLEENRGLLNNRPQCFQHGDYHVGNMMLERGGSPLLERLKIIDFDRFDFGDPWEEFNRIVWCAAASPPFATGQLRGYFGGEPPLAFFKLLAFYIASNTLSAIYWAIPFGQGEIDTMMKQSQDVLAWFDHMRNPVPTWYLGDFYVQHIDGVPYRLREPYDFSFLSRYGTVFKVFDDQDSGHICFGAEKDGERYFIKFAGAPTHRATVSAEEAVKNLKRTVAVYQDLEHPNLIKLIETAEVGGGFAMVFEWADAACMGRMYPRSRKKFMEMDLETGGRVFDAIMAFHAFAAKR